MEDEDEGFTQSVSEVNEGKPSFQTLLPSLKDLTCEGTTQDTGHTGHTYTRTPTYGHTVANDT